MCVHMVRIIEHTRKVAGDGDGGAAGEWAGSWGEVGGLRLVIKVKSTAEGAYWRSYGFGCDGMPR